MLSIDHLAVVAASLDDGVAHVENLLDVSLEPGGRHAAMGTHNRLVSLGPGCYLEVIAIDPEAPPPPRTRWFDLDRFSGPPRLSNWAARCDDLAGALAGSPERAGDPVALERGDLRWKMAVPEDGRLPFDGAFPALMSWEGTAHPSQMLPDSHCRLLKLELCHPEPDALSAALDGLLNDERASVVEAERPRLRALINTPAGERILE